MRPTVLLFDIDGTLITTGGAGRRALQAAFARLYGREDACAGIRFDGMTDRAIVRLSLNAIAAEVSPTAIDGVLDAYVDCLLEEVKRVAHSAYRVYPGMLRALEEASDAGMAIGLGTGNIRRGAKVKLDRLELFERFSFGGFGCDAEDRTELLRCGANRGAQLLGVPLSECRVVVIGDTPRDVRAAQGIGAESLAVATGNYTANDLLTAGATYAFADLQAAGAMTALLHGGSAT